MFHKIIRPGPFVFYFTIFNAFSCVVESYVMTPSAQLKLARNNANRQIADDVR
jgi:hypothetical protein